MEHQRLFEVDTRTRINLRSAFIGHWQGSQIAVIEPKDALQEVATGEQTDPAAYARIAPLWEQA